MLKSQIRMALVALTVSLVFAGGLRAEPPTPIPTYIHVPGLHCGGCAKKVNPYLAKVPGVQKVNFDLKTKTFVVVPHAGVKLSPRAIWEAVEKAAQKPTKLKGPGGTFDEKPRS